MSAAEQQQPYSIAGRYPDDLAAQTQAAAYHLKRLRGDWSQLQAEQTAIAAQIAEHEEAIADLKRKSGEVSEAFAQRTEHDRRVLDGWWRTGEMRNGRRKYAALGEYVIGERLTREVHTPQVTDETLCSLFPDLTTVAIADRREAKSRLRVDGDAVLVAETGEVVEGAVVKHTAQELVTYVEIRGEQIELARTPVNGEEPTDE